MKIICALLVLCAVSSSLGAESWNSLLGGASIFPEDLNVIQPSAKSSIVAELKTLLEQAGVLNTLFGNYVQAYNKFAIRSKDIAHVQIFRDNLLKIAEHNVEAEAGKHSWTKAVNLFTDMTEEEITAEYTGYKVDFQDSLRQSSLPLIKPKSVASLYNIPRAPASIDWRNYGVVTGVRNQGGCGSCVPFAATATLESSHAIWHNGQMLDLSEQELIDCSRGNGNNGCAGGTFVPTFDYLKNNGETTEGEYPYEGQDGSCRASGKSHPARVLGWWPVEPHGDENALAEAVSLYGPIGVAIHVNNDFQAYGGGIFEASCQGGRNHAVLAVGYGSENGRDYWLAKNSWGNWGEAGFIKIRRNYGNMCDIAGDAVLINA